MVHGFEIVPKLKTVTVRPEIEINALLRWDGQHNVLQNDTWVYWLFSDKTFGTQNEWKQLPFKEWLLEE